MDTRSWILIMAVAVLGACGGGDEPDLGTLGEDTGSTAASRMLSPPAGAIDVGEPLETFGLEEMEADTADQVTGAVRLYPDTAGAGFRLELVMDGLPTGGHAWHIHQGECGEDGQIVVPFTRVGEVQGVAQPLTADQVGVARAFVTIPAEHMSLQQLRDGRYSLHVHRRGGLDFGPTVGCANLFGGS